MGCLLKSAFVVRRGGSVGEALGEGSGVGRRFAVGVSRLVANLDSRGGAAVNINLSLPHHDPLPAERGLDALQPGPDLRTRLHDVVARRQTGHGPQDAVHGDVRQIH